MTTTKTTRFLQFMAVSTHTISMNCTWLSWPFFIYLFTTDFQWVAILYTAWLIYDRDSHVYGGKILPFLRNHAFYRMAVNYFPIKIVKTAELPPGDNYLAIVHPHGRFAYGSILGFGSGSHISEKFTGLESRILGHDIFFFVPIIRDIFLGCGARSVSSRTLRHLFNTSINQIAAMNLSGIRELLLTEQQPGELKVVVKGRRGFCRVALETGAQLVPVISFGEDRTYTRVNWGKNFFVWLRSTTGLAIPFYYGRGPFPHRVPINVVVGKPVKVEKSLKPTEKEIEELYSRYCRELVEMYEVNKVKYGYKHVRLVLL